MESGIGEPATTRRGTRARRVAVTALWLGVLVALVAATWWAHSGPSSGIVSQEAPAPGLGAPARNLLLVTIDTLRADRVGAYGYAAAATPALDDVARLGVRFDKAFAPAPVTLPSHASLLTGLNPPAHGARHNGIRLRDGVPTLATLLAARGFATAAFVSAFPLDRRFGLAQGFAIYDDRLPRGQNARPLNERRGAETVDAALAWLAAQHGGRFFAWVHLFEPHAPYGDPRASADTPTTVRYDGEIAEADRQVGRLLDGLREARDSTLIVIAGDHGEAFGEHGEITHSLFVYDTTLRVPLLMSGPGIPRGAVVAAPVGLIDVAATVLSGLHEPGVDSDGADLGRLMATPGGGSSRSLYAESLAPRLDFGWSALHSVRVAQWKYIAAPRPELYDVVRDPGEERNVVDTEPAEAARLAADVKRFGPGEPATEARRDREAAARLGALGYLTPGRVPPITAGADPKDRRAVAAALAEAVSGELPPERAAALLDRVLREDPGNPQAHLRLGAILSEGGDCPRAVPHLQRAIAADLPTADPYLSLASCRVAAGDPGSARRLLESARQVEPGNPVVEANIGLVELDTGRVTEAIPAFRSALSIDPDLHEARFALARALARDGQRDAARAEVQLLLKRLPASAPQRAEVERLRAAIR